MCVHLTPGTYFFAKNMCGFVEVTGPEKVGFYTFFFFFFRLKPGLSAVSICSADMI